MKTVDCRRCEQISASPEETVLLGEQFGKNLGNGGVAALSGPLGAGKTCFAKGIALALGVTEEITSPTYTIVSEYDGRVPFRHIDTYRLGSEEDFEHIGGSELLSGDGVTVVEWPEKISAFLPGSTIFVHIGILENNKRTIRYTRKDG
jgi:tRNA threonylcarbamoyladenosine biosynthesis protein TsaE